ncbi:hypothetical protein PHYSODRAFT_284612 [Phytophthora sojae]|uniref:RxLR effector protein n=2 Tax=Phytophthora sojae TaxID=67593 RepID=G4YNK0_PHYSP|nr:hypothetical protein PHYSODRAFT_284612 [Phytophthora sojae]AEK81402.1 RxL468 [Phytophthora sojae]AEK81403.1 RxL468 [Phytophthora sojae]AEK81404.1 RxL468 [Phytophthora sojae]EGZ30399.1 hypothetical protein PHYSODRAFT_284612 [Phytophthora sojae]|eukprot:XP_009517674.1 hypothetical protein PHYSODRAFT_284612 [Phytophthora sojae]
MRAYWWLLLLLIVAALHDSSGSIRSPTENVPGDQSSLHSRAEQVEVSTRRLLRASYNFADADTKAKDAGGEERVGVGVILAHYVQEGASTTAKAAKKAAAVVETTSGKLKRLDQFVYMRLDPAREYSFFNELLYTKKLNPTEAKAKILEEYGVLGKKLAKRYGMFYTNELKLAAS